jgi:hypothetical protein
MHLRLLAVAVLAFALLAPSALAKRPRMCGAYAKYACSAPAAKKHARPHTCGVYAKYDC